MLLLLDNLEQVVEAAPELSALLSACPQLTLLCTSRELLRVQGEVEYEVPPLVQPEAVAFLRALRARRDRRDRRALHPPRQPPLAVELAAARTKALTPAQILDRLSQRLDLFRGGRDADPRQQTLRATIAWSYDLLSGEEQRLFRGLSVFAGGCTWKRPKRWLRRTSTACSRLPRRACCASPTGRYWMLETIREYATERLEDADEAPDLRRRHAAHFVVLTEEAEPHLEGGPAQAGWLERLEAERDNLRASLAWARETDVELGLRLSAALIAFWHLRGPLAEARVAEDTARAGRRGVARAPGESSPPGSATGHGPGRLRRRRKRSAKPVCASHGNSMTRGRSGERFTTSARSLPAAETTSGRASCTSRRFRQRAKSATRPARSPIWVSSR